MNYSTINCHDFVPEIDRLAPIGAVEATPTPSQADLTTPRSAEVYQQGPEAGSPPPPSFEAERVERDRPAPYNVFSEDRLEMTLAADLAPRDAVRAVVREWRESLEGLDLAIFRNGYLVGLVRQGRDGKPLARLLDFRW